MISNLAFEINYLKHPERYTFMKRFYFAVFAMLCVCLCQAQDFKKSGKTLDQLVPDGWERDSVMGDLNKDGILDLVITTRYEQEVVEDGDTLHQGVRKLAIYFGDKNGTYTLVRKSNDALPDDDDMVSVEVSMSINAKGALILEHTEWHSMGSSQTGSMSTTYRYQDGDFYEIGSDYYSFSRMTGEGAKVSINYLSHKMITEPFNEFEDPEGKTYKKKTEKIPVEPLRRLED